VTTSVEQLRKFIGRIVLPSTAQQHLLTVLSEARNIDWPRLVRSLKALAAVARQERRPLLRQVVARAATANGLSLSVVQIDAICDFVLDARAPVRV